MLQTLLFRTPVRAYRLVYVGALLSYAIVVLKSLGKPRGVNWLRRAFVDENFQYGLLALYWLISKPINSEWQRVPRVSRKDTSGTRASLASLCSHPRTLLVASVWHWLVGVGVGRLLKKNVGADPSHHPAVRDVLAVPLRDVPAHERAAQVLRVSRELRI